MTFGTARQGAGPRGDPFDFACRKLLERVGIEPFYHHVLIDEGQDFPGGFYELCFALAVGERDQKNIVWAYDELQNILNVKIRSPDELFGTDNDGQPRVSLERAGRRLPPGTVNDTVLSKCYRNQREILVSAHALGFGIYGEIVQLLESRDHWQDVGYEVVSPNAFKVGQPVKIFRPPENSPLGLDQAGVARLIECHRANSLQDEVEWVARGVTEFLNGGLQPEDIMVISLDDRNARAYLRAISSDLARAEVGTNNITADPYDEPPFVIQNKVTLSTVYRAKGNEASVVFAVGVDAIPTRTRSGRNRLFTAFTRTKAWLRVSGLSAGAAKIEREIDTAMEHFPYLDFVMPDLRQVELIQRDLSQRSVRAKKIRDEFTKRLRAEGFTDDEIADLLTVEVKNGQA
jgi:superfamily I DNA and RNA helicase